jgi:hypothetical protein
VLALVEENGNDWWHDAPIAPRPFDFREVAD